MDDELPTLPPTTTPEEPMPPGAYKMIPVNDVLVPAERMTAKWKPAEWDMFVASIRERGILQPLTVISTDGGLYLVDGLNRLVAAKELGISQVPCIIQERIDDDVFINNVLTAMLKGKADPVELGGVLKHLTTEKGLTIEDASKKCSLSPTQARKYMRLVMLPVRIQDYVSQGIMGIEHAYTISGLRDPDKQIAVADDAVNYGYNLFQTKQAVKHYAQPDRELGVGEIDYAEGPRGKVILPVCEFCGEEIHPESQKTVLFHSHCWPVIREGLRQSRELQAAEVKQEETQALPQLNAQPSLTDAQVQPTPEPSTDEAEAERALLEWAEKQKGPGIE